MTKSERNSSWFKSTGEHLLIGLGWPGVLIVIFGIATAATGLAGFGWQYFSCETGSKPNTQVTSASPADGVAAVSSATAPQSSWTKFDVTIPILKTAQLFLLNSGAEDDRDHPSDILIAIARMTAVVWFVLVSWSVIRGTLESVRKMPHHVTRSNHFVICGLGQIGLQLVVDLHKRGDASKVVVVEKDSANPDLERARSLGATILIGDATTQQTLKDARVPRAKEVFVASGDDGLNIEIAAKIGGLLANVSKAQPLRVYLHVVDINLATTLRAYESRLHDSKNMSVEIFSVPRTAAAQLVTNQLWPYAPKSPNDVGHFAILGFGAMGQALALQLAQLGSFPNCKRNRFTIADVDIKSSASAFLSRFGRFTSWSAKRLGVQGFSSLYDSWDNNSQPLPAHLHVPHFEATQYVCNAEFRELPTVCDEEFALHLAERFRDEGVKPAVFICGAHDRQNFDAAIQLREHLKYHGLADVPIFVWLPRQPSLARALDPNDRLHPFGQCEVSASYHEITSSIREMFGSKIHIDYQEQQEKKQKAKGQIPGPRVAWADEEDCFRESNRVAADHAAIKLAHLNYKLIRRKADDAGAIPNASPTVKLDRGSNEIEKLSEMEHYRFVSERLLSGWCYTPPILGQSEEQAKADRRLYLNSTLVSWSVLLERFDGKEQTDKDRNQVETVLRVCNSEDFSRVALKEDERSRSVCIKAGRPTPQRQLSRGIRRRVPKSPVTRGPSKSRRRI